MDARLPNNPARRQDERIAALEARVAQLEGQLRRPRAVPAGTTGQIIQATADAFGVLVEEVLSARQTGDVALARHVAMHLARRLTRQSYPAIGRRFGRDHTTVMHADRAVAARCRDDAELRRRVEALAAALSTPQSDQEAA